MFSQSYCHQLQGEDRGSSINHSIHGLLVETLRSRSPESVLLLDFKTVCLAPGPMKDMYLFTSIIIRYKTINDTEFTIQVHYQCIDGEWSTDVLGSSNFTVSSTFNGTLNTTLRTDCVACLDPKIEPNVSTEEHCAGNK